LAERKQKTEEFWVALGEIQVAREPFASLEPPTPSRLERLEHDHLGCITREVNGFWLRSPEHQTSTTFARSDT
jgi:hypothetical protein